MAKKFPGFPEGWEIVGLYREGKGITEVSHSSVSSRQLRRADQVIVMHTDARGLHHYRQIAGPFSTKRAIGDLVTFNTQLVSPVVTT